MLSIQWSVKHIDDDNGKVTWLTQFQDGGYPAIIAKDWAELKKKGERMEKDALLNNIKVVV